MTEGFFFCEQGKRGLFLSLFSFAWVHVSCERGREAGILLGIETESTTLSTKITGKLVPMDPSLDDPWMEDRPGFVSMPHPGLRR
jgi:hypothetical protein